MRFTKNTLGMLSLSLVTGCLMPKDNEECFSTNQGYNPPDLNLTLIHKDMPKRYVDAFTRAELSFSTNQTQQTHAILNPRLTNENVQKIQDIPMGKTMKESEWDQFLFGVPNSLNGQRRVGAWQRFY